MTKIVKNSLGNFLVVFVIFSLAAGWFYSGWPRIWQNPPIPPEIQQARAASPEVFSVDGTFTPSNGIYAVTVECWGGGGGGGKVNNDAGGGGGGGAYAKSTNVAVAPGTGYAVDIGTGGASEISGADSTFNVTTVVADGGVAALDRAKGTGGQASASTGNSITSNGGDGGAGYDQGTTGAGGGGGGAGGPNGTGKVGANAISTLSGAGGDGNNSVGTGTGGTVVDNGAGNPGGNDLTYGGGGGAGSEGAQIGGAGGTPGGGGGGGSDNAAGGAGAPGRCIVSYTDTWAPSVSQTSYDPTWTFATAPNNDAASQISMTATTGYEYNTISYSFTFTACASNGGNGGTSSGWQAGASYTDTGLDPNKCYGYTVQTKDSLENTGTASSASETYSSANTPGTPILNGATATTLNLTNDANSNPSASPITNFAVQVTYTSPSDTNWQDKWVDASGNPSATEVWQTDAALDALVLGSGGTPLTAGTTYGVKVKARNENTDETLLSTEGQGTTSAVTYCITRTDSEGIIEYSNVGLSGSTSTEPTTGSNQTTVFQNCGSQAKFNIKTGNSTNWTAITGDPSAQTNQFRHSFATTSPVINWQVMGIDPSYQVASSTVDANASLNVYLRIELPGTDSSNYAQQSVTATVQAAAP